MDHQLTVTYTPQIIARSIRLQWYSLIRPSGLGLLAFLLALFLFLFITGDRSWIFGFSLAGLVVYGSIIILAYFRFRRISMSKLRNMEIPTAAFHFTDKGISVAADTGKFEFAWKLITKVVESPDVWVIMTEGGGVTLPTKHLNDELKTFIRERAKQKN